MVANSHGWARASLARGKEGRRKKRKREREREKERKKKKGKKERGPESRSTTYIVIAFNAIRAARRGEHCMCVSSGQAEYYRDYGRGVCTLRAGT